MLLLHSNWPHIYHIWIHQWDARLTNQLSQGTPSSSPKTSSIALLPLDLPFARATRNTTFRIIPTSKPQSFSTWSQSLPSISSDIQSNKSHGFNQARMRSPSGRRRTRRGIFCGRDKSSCKEQKPVLGSFASVVEVEQRHAGYRTSCLVKTKKPMNSESKQNCIRLRNASSSAIAAISGQLHQSELQLIKGLRLVSASLVGAVLLLAIRAALYFFRYTSWLLPRHTRYLTLGPSAPALNPSDSVTNEFITSGPAIPRRYWRWGVCFPFFDQGTYRCPAFLITDLRILAPWPVFFLLVLGYVVFSPMPLLISEYSHKLTSIFAFLQHVTDPPDAQRNFLVVDSKTETSEIERAFQTYTQERKDIAVVLINQHVSARLRLYNWLRRYWLLFPGCGAYSSQRGYLYRSVPRRPWNSQQRSPIRPRER